MTVGIKRIGISGCTGHVGQLLVQELQSNTWKGVVLSSGLTRSIPKEATNYTITDSRETLILNSDVIIDFSMPEATSKMVWLAAKARKPMVIGTTGMNDAQEKELQDASKECPIVYAANTSIGVTLLSALIEQAAQKLGPEWDIEVLETHHKRKVDAPSGTALMLGKSAAKGRAIASPNGPALDRSGPRPQGAIGFAVRRGGDVVGEHTVGFYGEGERIELSHIATDRRLFARGAIKAAQWVAEQRPGLYSMKDVLGLV